MKGQMNVYTRIRRLSAMTGSCAALAILLGLALGPAAGGAATIRDAASHTGVRSGALSAAIRPKLPCRALTQAGSAIVPGVADFSAIAGAPTHVSAATVVVATAQTPAYCDVQGYITPQIHFELRLPAATWQGRYLQEGCAGFCGAVFPPAFRPCPAQPGGDFAVASTDEGHSSASPGDGFEGLWASSDEQLRIDFGYRAAHVVAVAAKAIIAAYYGVAPRHSYFAGCSDGGREGLMEAQRYPHDFDGILAGGPANLFAPLVGELMTWEADVNRDAHGQEILTAAKLPALHQAVIVACDANDGVIDGQIGDPRACRFDPGTLRCPAGVDRPACLTPAQVAVVCALYTGPVDAQGRHLYPGGVPRGSELAWIGWLVRPDGAPAWYPTAVQQGGDNYLRYMGFPVGQAGPLSKDWRFTLAGFNRLRAEGHLYNATSADLRAFRAHGGKLILWTGWADPNIPPFGTLAYYQAVQDRMGGLAVTQRFARLFVFPSLYHCYWGFGPDQFDMLTPIVRWVERGTTPARIIATQAAPPKNNWTQAASESNPYRPYPVGTVVRTRPVFPYPMEARYRGTGSVDSATSFFGVMPASPPNDHYSWVGNDLFTAP
jgi:feruloyl esterase